MQDKQKVTLYLPPKLHRQLKIRAAVDIESMSTMVEKAIVFYLAHPEIVDEVETSNYGRSHQVYDCPECSSSLILREGEMVALENHPGILSDELPAIEVREKLTTRTDYPGEEKLVPC